MYEDNNVDVGDSQTLKTKNKINRSETSGTKLIEKEKR